MSLEGFGPLEETDFIIHGVAVNEAVGGSIQDAIVMRTIQGASTITLQVSDPHRDVLATSGNGLFEFGSELTVDGLLFNLVEITKASDTLQVVFEAQTVALLRQNIGVQVATTSTDLVGFVGSLLLPGTPTDFYNAPIDTAVAMGRGTAGDAQEDSWTCIQRVVTSAGWRCFETGGVIHLGPDTFFSGRPSQGTLQEWTTPVQNMDFDFDIGKPIGNVTVTGITVDWSFPPGAVVFTNGMGPCDGQPWLVQDCQRSLYTPQMTATLYIPMPPQEVISGLPTQAPF